MSLLEDGMHVSVCSCSTRAAVYALRWSVVDELCLLLLELVDVVAA